MTDFLIRSCSVPTGDGGFLISLYHSLLDRESEANLNPSAAGTNLTRDSVCPIGFEPSRKNSFLLNVFGR